ncbi:MAG: hypothetical protein EOM54_08365 [Clostridia bacterium]|nr:hypothetical protein [Clostridia bacterium]
MIVEIILVCLYAKIKHYKLKYLFESWTFYPVLAVQLMLVVFQFSIFFKSYYFIKFVPVTEPAVILSFIFAMFVYRLYKPAIFGSASIFVGTILNKFVIAQNGGKMPVFPSLSYITGYVTPEMFNSVDSLHILGNAETKFKFLTDYIDYGYSILSPGDVFIHLFACIMLYFMIVAVNK